MIVQTIFVLHKSLLIFYKYKITFFNKTTKNKLLWKLIYVFYLRRVSKTAYSMFY